MQYIVSSRLLVVDKLAKKRTYTFGFVPIFFDVLSTILNND